MEILSKLRSNIISVIFKETHRKEATYFTRKRNLTFLDMLFLLLQKSVKSSQNRLNEFFKDLFKPYLSPTKSAFTQARKKISYTAFVELSNIIVNEYYEKTEIKLWKGHRVFAVDGSYLRLPNSKEVEDKFGKIKIHKNNQESGYYVSGLSSVCYDVYNRIIINSTLSNNKIDERILCLEHLSYLNHGDILVLDRGYPSYIFFCQLLKKKINFVIRCPKNFNREIKEFYNKNCKIKEKIVTLKPSNSEVLKQVKSDNLYQKIRIRFIRVELSNGEIEVLATSLLDKKLYPSKDFKNLYRDRWGVETYYNILKNHLDIENFTGKTVCSVNQDFYSSIFISNLEVILTEDCQTELDIKCKIKKNKNIQKINRKVSFNIVKNDIIKLLYRKDLELEDILDEMDFLFSRSYESTKKGRKSVRKKCHKIM